MATSNPALTLTETHRASQARRAAVLAALVAQYYRTRVNVEDESSIDAWLALVVPRILGGRNTSARLAATYGTALRRLELPKAVDNFRFTPSPDLDPAVVRASLSSVGIAPVRAKYASIRELPDTQVDAVTKQALIEEANEVAARRVAGSVARHVLNGGRQTILDGVREDPVALGYVRVTKPNPCYFCAALASRGRVYADDSFDESDPRFTGSGTAKVHDSCGCGMAPVYRNDSELLDRSKEFYEMWRSAEHKGGFEQMREFRRLYEGRKQYRKS